MVTKLEKQFFRTFGIKTKYIYYIKDTSNKLCYYSATKKDILDYFTNKNHRKYKVFNVKIEHPQITDRILLELICIDNQENVYKCRPLANNVEELKTYILEEFIRLYELGLFKREQQVRTLFKEG